MKKNRTRSGFTLVEILISLFVFTVLMGGVMAFFLQMLWGFNATSQRVTQGTSIRKFTSEMIVQASRANQFILYKSVTPSDWYDVNKGCRLGIGSDGTNPLHPAGDFAVFVFYQFPKADSDSVYQINRIEGYFLDASGGATGRLRKVVFDCKNRADSPGVPWNPSTSADGCIESIMNKYWTTSAAQFSDFLLNIRGLAMPDAVDATTLPRIFYMQENRSLVVSGQIFQANGDVLTTDRKTYTDSFNFVITPRS